MLACKEKVIRPVTSYRPIYRSSNLSRYVKISTLKSIIRQSIAGESYGVGKVNIVLERAV